MKRIPTSMPFENWPVLDQTLWEAAFTANAFLKPAGPAAHWATAAGTILQEVIADLKLQGA